MVGKISCIVHLFVTSPVHGVKVFFQKQINFLYSNTLYSNNLTKYIFPQAQKPIRRGIKLWKQCDSSSGYCQQFEVYLGKNSTQPSKCGPIFDTVWSLCKNIAGNYHHIYVDNLFSSVGLARFCFSKGLYLNSTIRANKKLLPDQFKSKAKCAPPHQRKKKLDRGEYVTHQSAILSNLTCTLWQDTKDVRFLSTLSNPKSHTKVMHRVGHRYIQVTTPSCAKNYSNFMNGVDKHDKILSCFKYGALGHGSNKVWKHLFWHLVNMSCANAWILYSKTSTRQRSKYYDNMSFRIELAKGLIAGYSNRKRVVAIDWHGTLLSVESLSSHQFVRMKVSKPRRCVHHPKYQPNNKRRFDSLYGCFQCNAHMCRDCFRISHTTSTEK